MEAAGRFKVQEREKNQVDKKKSLRKKKMYSEEEIVRYSIWKWLTYIKIVFEDFVSSENIQILVWYYVFNDDKAPSISSKDYFKVFMALRLAYIICLPV